MADSFSKWVGGDNFFWARQWGSGKSNSADQKKQYGDACMRRRIRFNPNVTRNGHPADIVAAQSKRDKERYRLALEARNA